MNLTKDTDWSRHLSRRFWEDLTNKDWVELESIFRQIQADALRFAAERVRSSHFQEVVTKEIQDLANQLHPLREEPMKITENPNACTCPHDEDNCPVHFPQQPME